MGTRAELLLGTDALATVLEARGYGYRLLMEVFRTEPQRELLEPLGGADGLEVFPFRTESERVAQGAALARQYLQDPASGSAAGYDRLLWDFTRLFIGPERLPTPPWESAYRDPDRMLFTEETLAVREAYRQQGLQTANYLREPDDHISLELEFMHETCRMAAEASGAGDAERAVELLRDQAHFMDEHLLKWAPAFAADVVKAAGTDWYRGLAMMLEGFLLIDRRALAELLTEPDRAERPPEV